MNPARLAMAYQACGGAARPPTAVNLDHPPAPRGQAERVLAAARRLSATAARLTDTGPPADPLQHFAYQHPEEAAADIADWLRHHPGEAPGGAD